MKFVSYKIRSKTIYWLIDWFDWVLRLVGKILKHISAVFDISTELVAVSIFFIEIYWNYYSYSYLYFNSGHTCKHYWNYRYWCDTKYQMAISNTNKVMASIFSPVNQSCTNVKFLFSLWYIAYTRIILFFLFKLMYVNLSF